MGSNASELVLRQNLTLVIKGRYRFYHGHDMQFLRSLHIWITIRLRLLRRSGIWIVIVFVLQQAPQ